MTDRPDFRESLLAATELLEKVAWDPRLIEEATPEARRRLFEVVARLYSPDRNERRRLLRASDRRRKAARVEKQEATLAQTGIRELRRKPVFTTPSSFPPAGFAPEDVPPGSPQEETTVEPKHCYVCKKDYDVLHHFYDQLCPPCAELNFRKRTELADLRGRVALLTGGRVKIGYQAGLKLLRCGAELIVTTRFPRDSAFRYSQEPDFAEWGHRLEIFGLDLRHTPSVEAFCSRLLATRTRLDFIVNNACQTVRRPPAFYAHMMEKETAANETLPPAARALLGSYEGLRGVQLLPADGPLSAPGMTQAAALSQVPLLAEDVLVGKHLCPEGRRDQDLQQVDLRERNSWRLLLHEVSAVELLEVQLVNAIAPYLLNARLKPLMLKTPERDKHIV
ncbi:MAG: oxidoreductase, partial [Acidobacteria bacterium]|nr:oxidoreductase [Acidobacteriota bacterium]